MKSFSKVGNPPPEPNGTEPKIPLVVKPAAQIVLQTLLQPPSDPPSDDINANMFFVAELQTIRYLYNDTYRTYKSIST
jgi:hypothetical protein